MLISRICVTLLQSFSFTFYQLLPILIFQNLYSNSKSYLNSKPFSKLFYFHKRHSMLYVLSSWWNALFSLTNTWADLFLADLLYSADLYLCWPFFLLTMQNYDCLRTQPCFLLIYCKKMRHSWCRSVFVFSSSFIWRNRHTGCFGRRWSNSNIVIRTRVLECR